MSEIRRERLRQLIDELIPGPTFHGKAVSFAKRVDKDPRQVSAWLADPKRPSSKNISSATAREIELACMKPSGWLDTEGEAVVSVPAQPPRASHFAGIDPDILHEAETLVLSDEVQKGVKYQPRERSRQLAKAYSLLLSERGRLSATANARFVDSVDERLAGGEDRGAEEDERRVGAGTRAP